MVENKMPPLEEITEKPPKKEFNHDEHMAKVEEGLQRIIASEDIGEIKQIAQSLLTEEEMEENVEKGKMGGNLNDYLGGGK